MTAREKPTAHEISEIIDSNRWHLMTHTRWPKWWKTYPKRHARKDGHLRARPGYYLVFDGGQWDGFTMRIPRLLYTRLSAARQKQGDLAREMIRIRQAVNEQDNS